MGTLVVRVDPADPGRSSRLLAGRAAPAPPRVVARGWLLARRGSNAPLRLGTGFSNTCVEVHTRWPLLSYEVFRLAGRFLAASAPLSLVWSFQLLQDESRHCSTALLPIRASAAAVHDPLLLLLLLPLLLLLRLHRMMHCCTADDLTWRCWRRRCCCCMTAPRAATFCVCSAERTSVARARPASAC
jgi:hypothetical protein